MVTAKLEKARRFCIPKHFCDSLEIKAYQELELTIEYGCICIKKFDSNNIENRPYVGIVRNLDSIHRVVIPAEYVNCLGITLDTQFQLTIEDDKIIIKPL